MHIEEFTLERLQSLHENEVDINLAESGVHPYTLRELLEPGEIDELLDVRMGYGWTDGEPALRRAIADLYPETSPQQVLVTCGSAEANFLGAWSLVEPGDEVAMMVPNYLQIDGVARALGAVVRPWRLVGERGWAPDLDELRAAVGPKTRMIAVCNPNNPTGAVLERAAMEEIVEIADSVGAVLWADEVYRGVELDGVPRPSFRDLSPRAAVVSGLSKALAHPGLRIGWLVAEPELVAQAWKRNDYTTITTSPLAERLATWILEPERRAAILERNRRMLASNLALLETWVAERDGLVSFVPPRAGGMAFLRYHLPVGSTELSDFLRLEKSLLVLPGDVFGLDGYLRIGIGDRRETLAAGLERLAEGLEHFRARGS